MATLRQPGGWGWLLLLGALALVAAIDGGLANLSTADVEMPPTAATDYNQLIRGFEKGHLYLDKDAPPDLARLPDPYDSDANETYRYDPRWKLHDQSYYDGRLYLYFGATPALLAFWPWHVLTGDFLTHLQAVVAFSIGGFLAASCLLLAAARRYFPETGPATAAGCILLLGTTTTVPMMAARPGVWEVPIACAYFLLMAALVAVWAAWHGKQTAGRLTWAALAGLASGLAVGSRPSLVFAAIAVTVGAALAAGAAPAAADGDDRRKSGPNRGPPARGSDKRRSAQARAQGAGETPPAGNLRPRRRWLAAFLAAGLPMAAVGILIAAYNYSRFGNPLQFGQRYQLSGDNVHGRTVFSPAFLPGNLSLYFLTPPWWGPHFPFLWAPFTPAARGRGDVESLLAVLPNFPILLLAAAVPLAWRHRPRPERLGIAGFAGLLAALFLTAAGIICFFYGACNRYEVDFLPALALLACLGLLGLERTLAGTRPPWRTAVRAGLVLLGTYSVGTGTLAALARCNSRRFETIAATQRAEGRTAEAVRALRQAVVWSNDSRYEHLQLGLVLCDTDEDAEARRIFQEALREDPRDGYVHNDLGVAFDRVGRHAEALEQFREAVRIQPDDYVSHRNCGLALSELNRPQEAAAEYRTAARLSPNNPDHCTMVGTVLVQCGCLHEGIQLLERAVQLTPSSSVALARLGDAYSREGRLPEAIVALEKAQAAGDTSPELADNLARLKSTRPDAGRSSNDRGVTLAQSGHYAEAAEAFAQAVRTDPRNPEAHANLGNALLATGHPREAVAEFEAALRLEPGYTSLLTNLAYARRQLAAGSAAARPAP